MPNMATEPLLGVSDVTVVYPVSRGSERWLLEEENEPESALHDDIIQLLCDILRCWAARTLASARVGHNIALRWDRERPRPRLGHARP